MKRKRPGHGRDCEHRDHNGGRERTDQAKRFAPFGLPLDDLASTPDDSQPASVLRRNWMHTLVLRGELDRYSAATLEAEIERLCNTGVARLTLDLSQLTSIDVTGVTVIVYRCAWCVQRGCKFALIEGSAPIQRIFELVGATRRLPFVQPGADVTKTGTAARATAEVVQIEPPQQQAESHDGIGRSQMP